MHRKIHIHPENEKGHLTSI